MADSADSKVDPYGFERPEDFDYKCYEEFMASYLRVLARRASKWSPLMSSSKNSPSKSRTLKRYVRKGIPTEHRPAIWMQVSGAEERRGQNPGLYRQLVQAQHDPMLVDTIKTDIHRTFPDNIYFQDTPNDPQGKRGPLFNVLVALGHKNPSIGYCQGLNFIAGLLLLVVKDEEKVFWLMDSLVNHILPDYYSPDMSGVKTDSDVMNHLIQDREPVMSRFLENAGCAWSIICTKWFICCYADVLPVETVLRVWDCLFYEGNKVLLRVGVTLVRRNREKILKCQHFPQIMGVMKSMISEPSVLNCHEFMESIFKEPGSFPRSRIEQLRKEAHTKMLSEG